MTAYELFLASVSRSSARLTDEIDRQTGTTADERRALLAQRIDARLAAIGRQHYRPRAGESAR